MIETLNKHTKTGMSSKHIRLMMAVFSIFLTSALSVFVWIMLDISRNSMSSTLLLCLILITFVTIIAQLIYAFKGQVFEFDGRLAKHEVLFAIICFQIIMQFSFGFAVYAVNQTEMQNSGFDKAYTHFIKLQSLAAGNHITDYESIDLQKDSPEHIERVFTDRNEAFFNPNDYYRFPVSGGMLLMSRSQSFFTMLLQDFAIALLMSLVVSVLMMTEIVLLAVKFIDRYTQLNINTVSILQSDSEQKSESSTLAPESSSELSHESVHGPIGYLRQIAFLFYFTGFLGASFIPVIARNFVAGSPAADFIAGIPYSAEAFANCFAIIFTARIFTKKGWKPPFLLGVGIFIAGLLASSLAADIYTFVISRAFVGMGYGFCWMTLRNIATASDNRAEGFAGLSSGIYAGIMCGVAFGAVLADLVGFKSVLLISAVMAIIAAVFPLMLRNAIPDSGDALQRERIKITPKDIIAFVIFILIIVVPTGVTDAFNGFLLPLYINDLGLNTAYVGRVSLIYNLCLVYISSTILLKVVWKYIKKPLLQCALHLVIVSAAMLFAAYLGGFTAILIAGALLGLADGFGFSVQNSYILDTRVARKFGITRTLTWLSLFKKFSAMLAPMILGLFIMNGFGGLGLMAALFIMTAGVGIMAISLLNKKEGINN